MKSMAVFEAPPVPECWRGGELIRIVDPLGMQVAWVSPALAGGIVGYYVRETASDDWTEVLACSGVTRREAGSCLLLRDATSGELVPVGGTSAAWAFTSRDPTQALMSGRIEDHELSVSLQCADRELQIELVPRNERQDVADVGLRLYLGSQTGSLVTETSHDGELVFRGGVLRSLGIARSPDLNCRVAALPEGELQVDLVPASGLPGKRAASSTFITLAPSPSHPEITA